MLKGLTNTFKQNCNNIELTYREYIVINNEQIPVRAKLSDDSYVNGNFIGSFILKTIQFETSNDINYRNKEFEYYKVVNGESIKLGTFVTTEIEDNDTTGIVRVTGMDYGLKTQVQYASNLDYTSGVITLLDVWNEACTLSGLESGIEHFENDDFIVDSDQFTNTGATIRDVFIGIALSSGNFVKVMNDDKIYLIFAEDTGEIVEDYTDLEDKRDTHPWTCLRLGVSNIDGENVDLIDQELVEEYGEHWLILNDNPFAYNQSKREQLITAIFNKIKGFGYSSFVSKTSFKPYMTCGDKFRFRNRNGDLVDSILLRYTHEYKENDLQIQLEAPSETSATVNYVYPLNAIDISKRTQIEVDKENVIITSLTEQTQSIQNNLSNNYYTIDQANQLVQTAQTGITNTFSEAGGNNIFRNTGLWFAEGNGETKTGKNILDVSNITTTSYITNNGDGSITLNGSGTGGVSFTLSKPFTLKANTTYTLSLTNTNSSYSGATFILRNGNNNIFLINYGQSSISYTSTVDETVDTLRIYAPGNINFDNFTFSVQLEKGSTATSYEPYYEYTDDYEYWNGRVLRTSNEKASNKSALLLQLGTLYQEQEVPNGNYTVSFKYKKLITLADVKVKINDVEFELDQTTDTEFQQSIEVNSQHINVQFITDTNNSCEIYDLMVNAGGVKLAYSQNQNETTTDTVNISKGITITSSDQQNVVFKANADGVRIFEKNNMDTPKTKFTDKGTETNYLKVEDEAIVVDILIQKVGNQTWFTKI